MHNCVTSREVMNSKRERETGGYEVRQKSFPLPMGGKKGKL